MEKNSSQSPSAVNQEQIQPDKKTADAAKIIAEKQFEIQVAMMKETKDMITAAQEMLKKLPHDFEKGLDKVATMFIIQFGFGILFLISSVVFNMYGYDILTYIFGATGGLVLISTFITSSPFRLQKNRVDLAQWGISYFNWFNSLLATNQTITTALQTGTLTWDMFKDSQMLLLQITERTLWDIEKLCEFSKEISKDENIYEREKESTATSKTADSVAS